MNDVASRFQEWTASDLSERQMIARAAVDLDHHDAEFAELRSTLKKMTGIMTGILVSVTTAAVLLMLQLAAGK